MNLPTTSSPVILFEDDSLIAVLKPAGMPSQPDPTGAADLLSCLQTLYPQVFPVHRLDRVTGGVMIFARTKRAAAGLSRMMARRDEGQDALFSKIYLAVVPGEVKDRLSLTDTLLQDKRLGKSFAVLPSTPGGREARLTALPLAVGEVQGCPATLMEVTLKTGRFHQIRAQLSFHGLPLLGDGKYGSRVKCPLGLYAYHLTFSHPVTAKNMVITAPYPQGAPWDAFCGMFSDRSGSCKIDG